MFTLKTIRKRKQNSDGAIYVSGICGKPLVEGFRGSFSIEAALIMPLVLMCMFMPIWVGVELHQEVKQRAEIEMQMAPLDMIWAMYQQEQMEESEEKYED